MSVAIVGAGLAGLCCARELARTGVECEIFEASDGVGGRVRTDRVDGFLMDRGFQGLLTAYPECRRTLDYEALDLKPFYPGALVRFEGKFHRVGDPWRAPASALPTLFSPIGSLADKLRIARLRAGLAQYSVDQIFARHEVTARERLQMSGFGATMIDRFFRPFFGGIFLEPDLRSSSRVFDFVFQMLAEGSIAVPAQGMSAIPEQIAASLPPGTVKLNHKIESLDSLTGRVIVVATEAPSAVRLVGDVADTGSRSVWCYYFSADIAPSQEKAICLNGDGIGPINNCCVISNIAPSYAPAGAALISVAVLGTVPDHSEESVRAQCLEWFGPQAARWKFLRRYFIPHAQPEQAPPVLNPPQRSVRARPGLYICGDHRDNSSINGAMVSGRRAAEAVVADLH